MARSKYSRRRSHHKRLAPPSSASAAEGLKPDGVKPGPVNGAYEQDTPGRPKTASSRQQTRPGQSSQTGSAELDANSAAQPKR